MVKVSVKWGKQKFDDVDLAENEAVAVFKAQLYALTNVPPERQKIMGVKGGILKDDANLASMGIKEGTVLSLMGTAEGAELKQPVEKVVFEEDLSAAEKARILQEKTGEVVPAGLVNLGNTCYMNSTLQALRAVTELKDALQSYSGSTAAVDVTAAARDLFRLLETSGEAVNPVVFWTLLRTAFPQFNQQGRGGFMQQDAEECWNALLSDLSSRLKVTGSSNDNVVDKLFGLEFQASIKNTESAEEPEEVRFETLRKLPCHIDANINHLSEGIRKYLEEDIVKRSSVLERDATYRKTSRISKLPPYVMIQFVRFFWKQRSEAAGTDAGKAKILKNVAYPLILDLFEFCSPEQQKALSMGREIIRRKRLAEGAEAKKRKLEENANGSPASSSPAAAAATSSSSTVTPASSADAQPDPNAMDIDIPPGTYETGNYELVAVVTHKGRAADSGHYVGWVKKSNNKWIKYDDDVVSSVDDEEILKLRGGGDWHMAYLCLYRRVQEQQQ